MIDRALNRPLATMVWLTLTAQMPTHATQRRVYDMGWRGELNELLTQPSDRFCMQLSVGLSLLRCIGTPPDFDQRA